MSKEQTTNEETTAVTPETTEAHVQAEKVLQTETSTEHAAKPATQEPAQEDEAK